MNTKKFVLNSARELARDHGHYGVSDLVSEWTACFLTFAMKGAGSRLFQGRLLTSFSCLFFQGHPTRALFGIN